MNSKSKGESSEAQVIAALLRLGKVVLLPFGDNQRYDLVVDDGGKFVRIQVKTARRIDDYLIAFNTSSGTTENGKPKQVSYHGQIEFFAVYWPEEDSIYLVPVEITGNRSCNLRLKPAKYYTGKERPKFAKDYILTSSSSFSRALA